MKLIARLHMPDEFNERDGTTFDYLLQTLPVSGDLRLVAHVAEEGVSLVAAAPHPPKPSLLTELAATVNVASHPATGYDVIVPSEFAHSIMQCTPTAVGCIAVMILRTAATPFTIEDETALKDASHAFAAVLDQKLRQEESEHQQRLLGASRAMLRAPDPQTMLDTLQTEVLGDKIAFVALMHYGPTHTPTDDLAYAEVIATWAREIGHGFGLGTRIYLDSYEPLLERLHDRGFITPEDSLLDLIHDDALLRGLMNLDIVVDWALIALDTPNERVGALLVGTDGSDTVGALRGTQLWRYLELSEVLTTGVMIQSLQREQTAYKYGRLALANAVNDAVMIATPSLNGPVVALVNEPFRAMFNYQEEQPTQRLDEVLFSLQIPPSIRQNLHTAWKGVPFREQQAYHGEFEMVTHQGQPVAIHWYSAPMYDPEGDDVFARVFVFHDMLPEQAAVRTRTAFLSRVSHELRTPLTSISGFAQFILEAEGDNLPTLAREYTEIIQASAARLKQIFADLIDVTRAYSGELELSLYPSDVGAIIDSAIQHSQMNISNPPKINVHLSDNLPKARIDPERITQVLAQLLKNAYLFAPGTPVDVYASYVESHNDLPAHAPLDMLLPAVMVSVIDQGGGIPSEDIDSVFEPFHRGRNAQAQQTEGAGLGLTLAHSIVTLHRGVIWAGRSSTKTPGGRVHFTVPTVD
ncbi:MAG: PAS domain-containing sensor histidine kinase [Chloroflexota bacterium]